MSTEQFSHFFSPLFSSVFKFVAFLLSPIISFKNIALLNPQGIVAFKEFNLMITVVEYMVVVIISVFTAAFLIVRKYRVKDGEDNEVSTKYNPEWDHDTLIESIWWIIPLIIVVILSVITWQSSHDLDPFKPLDSSVKPVTIQVVALDWKWLFIYPEQGIATLNFVEFPAGTPINFQVTSDAPMNSFWIPQLGGQIYAMPGMSTQLHLEAFKSGSYNGLSANISGEGFSGMKFVAESVSESDFEQWVSDVKEQGTAHALDQATYDALVKPSQNDPVTLYSTIQKNLYNGTVMKYMMPQGEMLQNDATASSSMSGMNMQ